MLGLGRRGPSEVEGVRLRFCDMCLRSWMDRRSGEILFVREGLFLLF